MYVAIFGLTFPILLNWVRFRPGIWDGGATSSTGRGATDNSPTLGCLGLAPNRLSKHWGTDILPIFLLRLGSSRLMWIASLASLVTWEGSLSIMLKSSMEGRGWWKSLQCFSMADVVALECSLTLSPRALDVSPMYDEVHPSSLRHHQQIIHWTHRGPRYQGQVWLFLQTQHHWTWKRWSYESPKIGLGKLCLHLPE